MAIWDTLIDKFSKRVAAYVLDGTQAQPIIEARAYRHGYYRPQLKPKPGQFDDNIGVNLTGLLVSRITSQMLGGGVQWDFEGDTETPGEQYVRAVLSANHEEILLHRAGESASVAGTGYLQIIPNGLAVDGITYPRLQVIDPALITMDTLPEDYETVIRYTIEYKFIGADGKERARRRVVEHQAPDVDADGLQSGGNFWRIDDYEQTPGGQWQLMASTPWPYDFAPILHWQNLPASQDVYGIPDLTDAQIALQDRYNFVASNISKLIRYYAHPMRVMVGGGMYETLDAGPDKMIKLSSAEADIRQLEALGDLTASMEFLKTLRQSFFACGRVVDIDSLSDKLGALTNFGLRVLYADNLALIASKRELFGDMLEDLARRLQVLNGMEPVPAEIVWPDFLPVNEIEQMQAIQTKLDLGVMSKQSAADELGLDWEAESKRLQNEQQATDNIGAFFLRQFDQGQVNNGGPAFNRAPVPGAARQP